MKYWRRHILIVLCCFFCICSCAIASASSTEEPDTLPLADASLVIYELEKMPLYAGSYSKNEELHVLSTRPASLSKTVEELAKRYGVSIVVDPEAVTYSYIQLMDAMDKLTESMVELDIWQIALDEMENRLEVTSELAWNSTREKATSKAAGLSRNAFLFLTAPNTFTLVYPEEEIEQNDAPTVNPNTGTQMVAERPLNVRSGPGMRHDVIGELNTGDVVTILEQSGNWAQIRYANGAVGYVFFAYLDLYTGPEPVNTGTSFTGLRYATGSVNVRSGPGTKYTRLATLRKGNEVTAVAVSGNWTKIQWEGTEAYVYSKYLKAISVTD